MKETLVNKVTVEDRIQVIKKAGFFASSSLAKKNLPDDEEQFKQKFTINSQNIGGCLKYELQNCKPINSMMKTVIKLLNQTMTDANVHELVCDFIIDAQGRPFLVNLKSYAVWKQSIQKIVRESDNAGISIKQRTPRNKHQITNSLNKSIDTLNVTFNSNSHHRKRHTKSRNASLENSDSQESASNLHNRSVSISIEKKSRPQSAYKPLVKKTHNYNKSQDFGTEPTLAFLKSTPTGLNQQEGHNRSNSHSVQQISQINLSQKKQNTQFKLIQTKKQEASLNDQSLVMPKISLEQSLKQSNFYDQFAEVKKDQKYREQQQKEDSESNNSSISTNASSLQKYPQIPPIKNFDIAIRKQQQIAEYMIRKSQEQIKKKNKIRIIKDEQKKEVAN